MKWLHSIRQLFEHRAAVLMYHRVAEAAIDPWDLCVTPENFRAQLDVLSKKYTVLTVPQLLQHIDEKNIPPKSVCLTFDDGYRDNFLHAKPALETYNCPATFFIPSHFIGREKPFWWDELEAVFFNAPTLPQLFQIPIADDVLEFNLEDDATLTNTMQAQHQHWRWPQQPPTRRAALYLHVWEYLKPLPLSEIEPVITAVKAWAQYQPHIDVLQLPMAHNELAQLAANNLFHIGLHTATHPALAYHTEDAQYVELAENKKQLKPYNCINVAAFPYGSYNNSTIAVVRRQRLDAAFTTEADYVTKHTNKRCIGRFQVRNSNGKTFETQLQQWLKA